MPALAAHPGGEIPGYDHALRILVIWQVFYPFQKPDVVLSPSTRRKLGAVVRQQGSSCSVNCDLEYLVRRFNL
jgi:hypothetical protein